MIAVLAIVLEAAVPTPDVFASRAWGRFSRGPALAGDDETVEIALDGSTGNRPEYKLRLTRQSPGRPAERLWTNSRTCPAVRVVLERLRALTPPPIVPLGFEPQSQEVIVDGIGYSLTAPLADPFGRAKITWTSNMGSPVAAWVDDSLIRLKPCWSVVELRVMPATGAKR